MNSTWTAVVIFLPNLITLKPKFMKAYAFTTSYFTIYQKPGSVHFNLNICTAWTIKVEPCVLSTTKLRIKHFTGVRTDIKDVKIAYGQAGQTKCPWQLKRMSVFRQAERDKGSLLSIPRTFLTTALCKIDATSLFEIKRIILLLCECKCQILLQFGRH